MRDRAFSFRGRGRFFHVTPGCGALFPRGHDVDPNDGDACVCVRLFSQRENERLGHGVARLFSLVSTICDAMRPSGLPFAARA